MACILLWSSAVRVYDSQAYRKMSWARNVNSTKISLNALFSLDRANWNSTEITIMLLRRHLQRKITTSPFLLYFFLLIDNTRLSPQQLSFFTSLFDVPSFPTPHSTPLALGDDCFSFATAIVLFLDAVNSPRGPFISTFFYALLPSFVAHFETITPLLYVIISLGEAILSEVGAHLDEKQECTLALVPLRQSDRAGTEGSALSLTPLRVQSVEY